MIASYFMKTKRLLVDASFANGAVQPLQYSQPEAMQRKAR